MDLFDHRIEFTEEWAERLADIILEQLHRQSDPILRRRLLAAQLRALSVQIARETADSIMAEEL